MARRSSHNNVCKIYNRKRHQSSIIIFLPVSPVRADERACQYHATHHVIDPLHCACADSQPQLLFSHPQAPRCDLQDLDSFVEGNQPVNKRSPLNQGGQSFKLKGGLRATL